MTKLTETALGVIAAVLLSTTAMADTKIVNGCEVVKADNGNYYSRVDGSCNGTLGAFFKPSAEDALNDRAADRETDQDEGEHDPKA